MDLESSKTPWYLFSKSEIEIEQINACLQTLRFEYFQNRPFTLGQGVYRKLNMLTVCLILVFQSGLGCVKFENFWACKLKWGFTC